ncbi:hypothetical protein HDV00_007658 [Rhizophlyctis rosea]|nr:hypothetical protein HDV00_007658 [Rhizophlyctis rosea]
MLIYFFKQQKVLSDNYGQLLADFFKFYGSFDYERFGVCPRTGIPINKAADHRPWRQTYPPDAMQFMCEDACDKLRDIARSSRLAPQIFEGWKKIHHTLHTILVTSNPCESILSVVVEVPPQWEAKRKFVINLWNCMQECWGFDVVLKPVSAKTEIEEDAD